MYVCLWGLRWVLSIVCKRRCVSEVRTGSALPFSDSRQCELIRMQWKLDASRLHCFDSVLWAAKEEAQLYRKVSLCFDVKSFIIAK